MIDLNCGADWWWWRLTESCFSFGSASDKFANVYFENSGWFKPPALISNLSTLYAWYRNVIMLSKAIVAFLLADEDDDDDESSSEKINDSEFYYC